MLPGKILQTLAKASLWGVLLFGLTPQVSFAQGDSRGQRAVKTNNAVTGRALLIGINRYKDTRLNLPGCVEDANETAKFIKAKYGFKDEEIKILTNQQATAAEIVRAFEDWLIKGTKPGERVFFLYSGHGSQLPDDNGDETDKFDETIVPWDANPRTGANEIRDDRFESLIAQLSGRMAVLVFDSCHSGTISRGLVENFRDYPNGGGARYLPPPSQFVELYGNTDGGKGPEGGYVVKQGGGSRGPAESFVDPDRVGDMSGVVVFSAASPSQVAWPILVDDGARGALCYLFTSQGDENLPLRSLEEKITSGMANLYQQKRLQAPQDPQFEVISSVSLDDQPLFATPEHIPEIALANPQSSIKVSIRTTQGKTTYRLKEKISYEIESDTDGYLYLLVFSTKNVATCLFPNTQDRNNQIRAGKFQFPRKGYEFEAQEPIGRDIVVALVSKTKLNLGEKEDYTWEEVFQCINLNRFSEYVKGQGSKAFRTVVSEAPESIRAWQSDSIVVETLPQRQALLIAAPWKAETAMLNDQVAMQDALRQRGLAEEEIFTLKGNLDRKQLLRFLEEAGQRAAGWSQGEVLLFFSGHGFYAGTSASNARPAIHLFDELKQAEGTVYWDEVFASLKLSDKVHLTVLPDS